MTADAGSVALQRAEYEEGADGKTAARPGQSVVLEQHDGGIVRSEALRAAKPARNASFARPAACAAFRRARLVPGRRRGAGRNNPRRRQRPRRSRGPTERANIARRGVRGGAGGMEPASARCGILDRECGDGECEGLHQACSGLLIRWDGELVHIQRDIFAQLFVKHGAVDRKYRGEGNQGEHFPVSR